MHALFVISGRVDSTGNASGCNAVQEDFEKQVRDRNIIFRIPTPVFGAGLIEMIKDSTLVANLAANTSSKSQLGISGRLNRNGNDGTVSRFGWKAQNQSLLLFSGEAYNVEMGITNELFQSERDENPNCQFATVPNDTQLFDTDGRVPGADHRDRELRQLPALPGSADTGDLVPRRLGDFDHPGQAEVQRHRLCAVPHAEPDDLRRRHGRGIEEQGREPVLRRGAAQHGAGPGGRRQPRRGARR